MPTNARKLLKNQALELSVQVTGERLRSAGIVVEKRANSPRESTRHFRVPAKLIKRLAGV
jgi:hypothetical protein